MIVLDTSVLVAALVGPEPLSGAIRRRLVAERLVAPELIDIEAASSLRGLARGGKLSVEDAERALKALVALPVERVSHAPLLRRVWELRDNLSAYDATYVALAEALGVTLLTGDRAIGKATGVRCVVEVIG